MRVSKVIGGVVMGVIFLWVLLFSVFSPFSSPYLRFMSKDRAYFSQLAHACDSILQQQPVSSKDTVTLYPGMVLSNTMKLSGHESSLPKIISRLHPDMILVSTNSVFIEIPPERMGGFGISWEKDDMRSNYWTLESNGDGQMKKVYEERRQ